MDDDPEDYEDDGEEQDDEEIEDEGDEDDVSSRKVAACLCHRVTFVLCEYSPFVYLLLQDGDEDYDDGGEQKAGDDGNDEEDVTEVAEVCIGKQMAWQECMKCPCSHLIVDVLFFEQ